MTRSTINNDYVEIEGEITARSPSGKAILFYDGDREVWLPLSQIEIADDEESIIVPHWLAKQEGLI